MIVHSLDMMRNSGCKLRHCKCHFYLGQDVFVATALQNCVQMLPDSIQKVAIKDKFDTTL